MRVTTATSPLDTPPLPWRYSRSRLPTPNTIRCRLSFRVRWRSTRSHNNEQPELTRKHSQSFVWDFHRRGRIELSPRSTGRLFVSISRWKKNDFFLSNLQEENLGNDRFNRLCVRDECVVIFVGNLKKKICLAIFTPKRSYTKTSPWRSFRIRKTIRVKSKRLSMIFAARHGEIRKNAKKTANKKPHGYVWNRPSISRERDNRYAKRRLFKS